MNLTSSKTKTNQFLQTRKPWQLLLDPILTRKKNLMGALWTLNNP